MKWITRTKSSIKIKLLFLCILLSLLMTFILYFFLYTNTKENYVKMESEEIGNRLSLALLNIDQDYLQITQFAQTLSSNQTVEQFLSLNQSDIDSPFNVYTTSNIANPSSNPKYIIVHAYVETSSMLTNLGIYDTVAKCIITSARHDNAITVGWIYGHPTDLSHFIELCSNWEQRFPAGIVKSPFFYSDLSGQRYVIPLQSKIYAKHGTRQIGTIYFALSDKWITNQLGMLRSTPDDSVLININDSIYEYSSSEFTDVTDTFNRIFSVSSSALYTNVKVTDSIPAFDGDRYVIVSANNSGIILAQKLSNYQFNFFDDGTYQVFTPYLLIIVLIVVLFYNLLQRMIKRPIKKICDQLHDVSQGIFQIENTIHTSDEFWLISQEIVNMAGNIHQLMKKELEDEKLKQNYQFQMLQSQINPHFLYNTLNSIRWLGEINGIPGVVDMTATFSNMLRQTFRNPGETVPLKDELNFIKDYSVLQSYRYGNMFEIEYLIEKEALYQAQMIKFTLQPLVENAIFHGIEPSHSRKKIQIKAEEKNGDLLIRVIDNGVGIEQEDLEKLNDLDTNRNDKMSGIGIYNIHKRITIEYGPKYGLHIESKVGEYTCVYVLLPLIYTEDNGN